MLEKFCKLHGDGSNPDLFQILEIMDLIIIPDFGKPAGYKLVWVDLQGDTNQILQKGLKANC